MRMIDAKDVLPQGFTPVEKTTDTGEETGSPPFSLGFFFGLVFVSFFFFLILRPAQAEVLRGSFAGDKECFMGAG